MFDILQVILSKSFHVVLTKPLKVSPSILLLVCACPRTHSHLSKAAEAEKELRFEHCVFNSPGQEVAWWSQIL